MGVLTGLSLFSGAGGLDLAAKWAGIRTVGYVELDRYAQGVLMSRMRDGSLDPGPIWSDVTTFDGKPWRGKVDCVFGGFPCQPHSQIGKRKGEKDSRNLWPEMLRVISEVGPRFVVAENVIGIFDSGYAAEVLASLEEAGYGATPYTICACAVGAPHSRERVFFVADSDLHGWSAREGDDASMGGEGRTLDSARAWQAAEPKMERVADGVAFRVDRSRCIGNGVVPQQAFPAFQKIIELAGE